MNDVDTNKQSPATPLDKKSNGNMLAFLVIIAIAVIAGGAYYFLQKKDTVEPVVNTGNPEISDAFSLTDADPVAKVDGVEISGEVYRRSITQTVTTYQSQGIDISSTEAVTAIKQQVLDGLISRQLVLKAGIDAGVTVDDAAVETEYQNTITGLGGSEALAEALSSVSMSEADLRSEIKDGLIINGYLTSRISPDSFTFSDEEVLSFYETAKTEAGETAEIPPLEEVRDVIVSQLRSQAEQQAINAEIERLRAEANIEILI